MRTTTVTAHHVIRVARYVLAVIAALLLGYVLAGTTDVAARMTSSTDYSVLLAPGVLDEPLLTDGSSE